jgi:hypothetical protein
MCGVTPKLIRNITPPKTYKCKKKLSTYLCAEQLTIQRKIANIRLEHHKPTLQFGATRCKWCLLHCGCVGVSWNLVKTWSMGCSDTRAGEWKLCVRILRRTQLAVNCTQCQYTGCFTTCGHYCRRWFPRSLWRNRPMIPVFITFSCQQDSRVMRAAWSLLLYIGVL